ncbi:MBL fold metallo-hydrolase [Aquirufa sp. Wall-65K1]
MIKRRQFIQGSANTLLLSCLLGSKSSLFAQSSLYQGPAFTWKDLRGGISLFSERGGTIAVLKTKDGYAVVDTQFPDQSQHVIDELKKQSDQKIQLLMNTHHHGDHTSGNIAFKGIVNRVVAHENSLKNQIAAAARAKTEDKQYYPTETFQDTWTAKIGKERIRAHYFGPAHTNGDVAIHFEHANVVHLGDLFGNKRYPIIDRSAGASVANWIHVNDKIQKQFDKDTIFTYGHAFNPTEITCKKEDLLTLTDYLEKLIIHVSAEIKSGKTKEEVMKLSAVNGVQGMNGDFLKNNFQMAYEELTEKNTKQ